MIGISEFNRYAMYSFKRVGIVKLSYNVSEIAVKLRVNS